MHRQGWPNSILRWTSSFLRDRRVHVRYLGGITSPKDLTCGIPKDSPISSLLFLLYMAEPMKSGKVRAHFGYADDIGALAIGRTISESLSVAQREVDSLSDWTHSNAVSFDIKKSDVIQFLSHRQDTPINI
ncbi:putative te1b-like protein [Erysiphe necator]|uniref:Putative te1b-like protein n=1 Tax=Uncinula necator TaxID=52586 RepID=A0A0B1P729_UNCNE|nr:putative te1b-like protein [Erysiphe necator]